MLHFGQRFGTGRDDSVVKRNTLRSYSDQIRFQKGLLHRFTTFSVHSHGQDRHSSGVYTYGPNSISRCEVFSLY
jgi:hypothetical protein